MKSKFLLTTLFAATLAGAAVPYRIGVAGYSFAAKSLDETLATLQAIDCHLLCHKDFHLAYTASDADLAAFKAKLAAAGVECVATGPLYAKDEATLRSQFEFAKRVGIRTLVGVPYEVVPGQPDTWGPNRVESDAVLDIVEKLVKEYDMVYAIHNHGPDLPTLFPTAESVWRRIEKRDARIGLCLDVGHEARAGFDPAESIRMYAPRIYDVHLKNIKIDAKTNIALQGPRGELDVPAIMKALADAGYERVCHIEYERDFKDNALGLAESLGYFRGIADTLKAPARMQPPPAGANTLTAEEKAAGFQLLFDGEKLPVELWVGVKTGCTSFPEKGWFVKDGSLTMRPVNGIHEGKWFPLPPEDQKLGGGGDIATVKKYRNFEFKFDFRLTEAANSGVKYFYDETTDKGACEEYQILENGHPDSTKGREGNRRLASLYDLFPAHAEAQAKPLGEWNSGRIVAKGAKVEHWLNGVKVLEYERGGAAFRAAVQASKYATWGQDAEGRPRAWGENAEGRLLLQDHGDSVVSFCNLKVRVIGD